MPKIILLMIIKNESAIIRRCLDRVNPYVDGFCICDTGSTDNTLEMLEEPRNRAIREGKKFHVAHHQWRNFGHNRSLSFSECRNWLRNIITEDDSWSLDKTWGLLLDADMVLRVEDLVASKQFLENAETVNTGISCFQLLQKNGNLVYWNTRLIRMSHTWVCRGVTHEYWESVDGGQTAKVMDDILWINDVNDGGAKMDKFERDVRLLEDGLVDPTTPELLKVRYYFYLAQTYLVMRNIPRAIENYNKRIEAEGWIEEVWYSHFQKYNITQSREDLWKGVECMPQRLENIHAYFKNKRERGIKYTQEDFAIGAIGYSYLKKRNAREMYLFMEEDVYTWRFMDEYSLVCFYTDHREEGKEITAKLLTLRDKIDEVNYRRIQQNMSFYQ